MKPKTLIIALLLLTCVRMVNAGTIEVPPAKEHDGIPSGPFSDGANRSWRWQQVYSSAAFSSFGQGAGQITSLSYQFNASGGTVYSVQVNLSTTSKAVDGLSTTFSENIGADDVMVLGPSPLYWSGGAGYDGVINFTTPFVYNPAAGNLLVDLRVFSSGRAIGSFETLNVFSTSRPSDWISTAFAYDVNATIGYTDTLGMNTLFSYTLVPEPATGALTVCIIIGWGAFRQRHHKNSKHSQRRP